MGMAGASSSGQVEDAAAVSGGGGTAALSVRKDTAATTAGTDGDFANIITDANGRLHTLDQNSAAMAVVGGGTEATAQRVTIANDSTGVVSVDDNGGSLTVDGTITEANSAAIKTAVELLDNCVAGNELQVDIVSGSSANTEYTEADTDASITGMAIMWEDASDTLRAVSAAKPLPISDAGGTLTVDGTITEANSAAIKTAVELLDNCVSGNEMQVDIVSGGTGSTQYAEDAGHTTGDTGTMGLAVRHDTIASLADADLDYVPLQVDATGYLYTRISDGGGAITVDGTVTANLSATDNTVLDNIDSNTDYGAVVGGGAEATALRVTLANDSTGVVSVDDGGGALTVDGTVTETNSAAIKTAVELIDNAISGTEMQVDVVAALPAGDNNIGNVDIASGTITTLSALTGGGVAHDAADSGNPVKIGTRVERTAVTEMADADRSDALCDNFGNLYIANGQKLTYTSIDKTTTAAQDIVAAPGAGYHLRIYGYTISNEGTEQTTCTITNVASFGTKDGGSINYHLPGYIDLATNTACQASLSATSTNGVVVGIYYRTMAD